MCIIKGVRDDFKQASQRAKNLKARIPRVVSAHYDRKTGRIVIHLSSRLIVSFSPADAEGLEGAQPSQLKEIGTRSLGGLSGLESVDGVQRPFAEQGKTGCLQSEWKTLGAGRGRLSNGSARFVHLSTAKISMCRTVRPFFDKPLKIIFMAV